MRRWIWNRCRYLSVSLLLAATAFAQGLVFEFRNGEYRLEGWTGSSQVPIAGWESVFPIYAGSSETAMLGTYRIEGSALIFRPRFPVDPEIAVHGTFPGGSFFLDPAPKRRPLTALAAHVEQVYPSADILPVNTLRMYIHFSAPMRVGEALEHIRLKDETGQPVPDAFLDQELWDPDHKRLTILFDPGRIKRGLVPLTQVGMAIVEGKHYALTIDSSWRDAEGARLREDFGKAFVGGPAERRPVDPKNWLILAPRAGTTEALVVHFRTPMDHALLQRMLGVSGMRGTVAVGGKETEWRFTPEAPWKKQAYILEADADLEDICGNHLDRPFDIDLHERPPAQPGRRAISIPFVVE